MFLYVNIKRIFTYVRTEIYNLHGETGTSLYAPSLKYIFHKYVPPHKSVDIMGPWNFTHLKEMGIK